MNFIFKNLYIYVRIYILNTKSKRKEGKEMKKIFIALLFSLSVFSLTGCDLFAAADKEFSGTGMTIILNEDFVVTETVMVPFYVTSLHDIFSGMRESKSLFVRSSITNLEEYAEAVLENGGHSGETLYESEEANGYFYAYYTALVEDVEYGYMLICMETDDYYYLMNFGCLSDDLEDSKEQYIEWTNTLEVE